jgi:predicted acylesterase/phospholipase RssA
MLIEKSGNPQYRLADFFDYIAGTSTGGIIAAGLSLGMRVADILSFYTDNGKDIFDKASIVRRLRYQFNSEPLAEKLREVFGATMTLGSGEIETLLLLVSARIWQSCSPCNRILPQGCADQRTGSGSAPENESQVAKALAKIQTRKAESRTGQI